MRKNATKIAAMALTLALTVTSVTLPSNTASAAKKTGLNQKKATLFVDTGKTTYADDTGKNTTTLQLTVNGKKKNATFTSSKKSVATVSKKGKVTAKKKGKAVITAKYNKKSYKCTITVKNFVKAQTVKITSPKSKTLKVGQETWIKQTVGPNDVTVDDVAYKSSDAKIVKVGSRGKVRGKKEGKATITVTAKYGWKKAKAKITFTVKKAATPAPTNAPSTTPSQAPSGAPSDAPSQAPSGAPSDAPSQAPSGAPSETPSGAPSETPSVAPGELSEITDLTVTKADELTAVFGAAVPEDVEMSVANGEKALEGEWKWSEDRKTATFTCKGDLPTKTTVTVTATLGDKKVSKDVAVAEREVKEIKIINEGENNYALTGRSSSATENNKDVQNQAYIYYDVVDQYGESMRESETIAWTVSPGTVEDNKTLGKLTVTNGDGFTFGDQIYLTGVYAKNGTTKNCVIKVGMPQAVDKVEFKGFVNKNDLTNIIAWEKLPADFSAKTYYLLYKSFDQSGNPLEMDGSNEYRGKNLTFLSSDTTLIENPAKPTVEEDGSDNDVVTVAGDQYGYVKIEPGMYVDRGGEVTITAISTKTGQKTERVLTLGKGGRLQSLELKQPTAKVTNGEQEVDIPYKAMDIDGNEITDYETIARSSHELKLTVASGCGKLELYEKNDGTAGVRWSDTTETDWYTSAAATSMGGRSVALTSVVVGGDSKNLMLQVDNTRRPASITGVKVTDIGSDYLVSGTQIKAATGTMIFVDQYGSELPSTKVDEFFQKTAPDQSTFGDTEYHYGIRLDVAGNATTSALIKNDNGNKIEDTNKYFTNDQGIEFTGIVKNTDENADKIETESVKYSIIRKKATDTKWDVAGKSFSATYSILPIQMVKNPEISEADIPAKVQLEEVKNHVTSSGDKTSINEKLPVKKKVSVKVVGQYSGKDLIIPNQYWHTATDSEIYLDNEENEDDYINQDNQDSVEGTSQFTREISGVRSKYIKVEDLYTNYQDGIRQDATKALRIAVQGKKEEAAQESKEVVNAKYTQAIVKSNILLSDAPAVPTTIQYYANGKVTSKATFNPSLTKLALNNEKGIGMELDEATVRNDDPMWGITILDQYGNIMDPDDQEIEYEVREIKENEDSLAHKDHNCTVTSNGTSNVTVEGAEIGDTFKLKLSVRHTNVSTVVDVTVGADECAVVSSDQEKKDNDKALREELGYNR